LTNQLLTPAMAGLLDRIRRARRPAFHTLTPAEARAAYEAGAEVLDLPRAPLAQVDDVELPGGDGRPRRARVYADNHGARPTLLYFHGGGFVVGSLDTHDSLCRQLAHRSGWRVVALDYRLAPEHRFPAAVDDAWAALGALNPQAVGGDSAGGTLAAACALHARDRALPLALQLLITPGTAARGDSPSRRLFGHGFLLDAETIDWFFDHYADPHQRHDWRFAPLEADVDGVAPACVILAECDPVVDEGLAYADKLRAAGVPVHLELFRGVTHEFIKMGRALPQAQQALDAAAAALQEAMPR
jgi:acetyl esterase